MTNALAILRAARTPKPAIGRLTVELDDERAVIFSGDSKHLGDALGEHTVDAIVCDPPAGIGYMAQSWDRARVDLPDVDFLNWFAGFIDGEGCFSVHKKNVRGYDTYDCQFAIALRRDDAPILKEIKRRLKIGTFQYSKHDGPDNPQARFCVSSKADCLRLVEILRAAPLRAKKAIDFETWVEALAAWIEHKPLEWSEMRDARERLMSSRRYTEYEKVAGSPERRAFIASIKGSLRPALHALKPGGFALVWALPRTSHWTATALEDLGFEICDVFHFLFGTGFPKSLTSASAEIPAWSGTALKPAAEHWIVAQKPTKLTVAETYAEHGTGVLNINACRVGTDDTRAPTGNRANDRGEWGMGQGVVAGSPSGRWPAHVAIDEHVATDLGEVARYFYCAKPSRRERDAGLAHLAPRSGGEATGREDDAAGVRNPRAGANRGGGARNFHPTVKSIALMRWLCRLITPPGGTILDPFAGSGSTGVAALAEGFRFVGCELGGDAGEYLPILVGRIRHALSEKPDAGSTSE